MTLKIISAEHILFQGEAVSVTVPGEKGRFTVLPQHASIVSTLTAGAITYRLPDGSEERTEIGGGIVDVDRNVVSVCVY